MRTTPANPILAASTWCFSEILETEADFDSDIFDKTNFDGRTALIVLSMYNQRDFVRLLLENKIALEAKEYVRGDTALSIASILGHDTIILNTH